MIWNLSNKRTFQLTPFMLVLVSDRQKSAVKGAFILGNWLNHFSYNTITLSIYCEFDEIRNDSWQNEMIRHEYLQLTIVVIKI